MAVPSVFISSVVRGFERVRDRAAEGVERVGMHPVRSERLSASSASPRRALLDQIGKADIYLLLVGERYGESQPSPTEQEYEEAVRLRKPILILVQDGQRDPEQEAFLARVRSGWEGGVLSCTFSNDDDVAAAVAAALGRHQAGIIEDAPAAQARATELASRTDRHGSSSGVAARVVFVPLRHTTLLDPEALEAANLGNDLAAGLRAAGVVTQRVGLDAQVTGAGVHLQGTDAISWVTPEATVHADGAIVALASVAVDDAPMGFSLVDPDKLEQFVRGAGRFARATWDRIDERGEVSQVAVVAAIPDASYKGFGRTKGSSMTMSMSLPPVVVAPEPAEVVPRGQVDDERVARRIVAAVKRIFSDAGGTQE
jgi:Domain of unknown function (DUF4062)